MTTVLARTSVLFIAPLALVACGNGGDDAETSPTSTVTSSATPSDTTSSATPSEETSSEEATPSPSTSASPEASSPEPQEAPAQQPAVANPANPFENGDIQVQQLEPIDGEQASPEVQQQLHNLVGGIYQTTTLHEFISYMPEHTCQSVMDQAGAQSYSLEGVPDLPMKDLPGFAASGLESVDDVRVNGDSASASVTVRTPEGVDTATQRFRLEGGQWTFCD